jgi:hypothetical protein
MNLLIRLMGRYFLRRAERAELSGRYGIARQWRMLSDDCREWDETQTQKPPAP